MVTSRRERKCIDSSSAGRAGIFYCSSWRTVCWLPVPPPAGQEDTQQDKEGHRLTGGSSSTTWKPVDSTKQTTPATPITCPDEDVCCGVTEGPPPSPDGNGLSNSVQCERLCVSCGTSAAIKDPRQFGENITASVNNRQARSCHTLPKTCKRPDHW